MNVPARKTESLRISIVIPAHNEEQYLPGLLDSIDVAVDQYTCGHAAVEVIVADNASTDATSRIAQERGCHVVYVKQRSIAKARNQAARIAKGEILAFVDADSQIHPDTLNAIERTLTDRVVIGATGVRLSRMSLGIALSWYLCVVPVIRIARVDTGVVFCRRIDWESTGGYREDRIAGEDIDFFLAMKQLGRSRGQNFARAKGVFTITSARKFDRYGDWHYFTTLLPRAAWAILMNRNAFDSFFRKYYYDDPD